MQTAAVFFPPATEKKRQCMLFCVVHIKHPLARLCPPLLAVSTCSLFRQELQESIFYRGWGGGKEKRERGAAIGTTHTSVVILCGVQVFICCFISSCWLISGDRPTNTVAAASLEVGINPRRGSSCRRDPGRGATVCYLYPSSPRWRDILLVCCPGSLRMAVTGRLPMNDHGHIDRVCARGQTPCH